nr:cell division protein FtsQ/DivIB [Jannaschia sp. Os4]
MIRLRAVARAVRADAKWAWRAERLWLTPSFRRLVRVGIPLLATAGAIHLWLGDPARLAAVQDRMAEVRRSIQDRPQFMVTHVSIEGASAQLREDIAEAMPVDLPLSQFALDTAAIRAGLESLDPVERAEVRVAPGGMLAIRITERDPAVVWAHADGVDVLDATGHRIATVADVDAAGPLPRVAGEGAGDRVEEALRLMAAAGPVAETLVGLVRVGERRWDVVLADDKRILLPEVAPAQALDRALALHAATDVLSRDAVALDMRVAGRPTVRMGPEAVAKLRAVRAEARAAREEDEG